MNRRLICAASRGFWQYLFALLLSTVFLMPIRGQTISVRLLDAKSGKAMTGKNVTLKWDVELKSSKVAINGDGTGRLDIPPNATAFLMITGPRNGSEPFRIAYQNCNEQPTMLISIAQVLEKGVVPRNVCGHQNAPAKPGQIVFWALPLPWWKPDFQ